MVQEEIKTMTQSQKTLLNTIKSEEDHNLGLNRLQELISLNPPKNTPEGDELEVISLLLEDYEAREYNILPPDPVDAIIFRMDQLGLTRKNLEAYLGGRSRVSEVLSRKKPLSLSMIKSLYSNLGIPGDILLSDPHTDTNDDILDIHQFPVDELLKRGWLSPVKGKMVDTAEAIASYLAPVIDMNATLSYYRRNINYRSGRAPNEYSMIAWAARVWHLADQVPSSEEYDPENLNVEAAHNIVKLSTYSDGPVQAIEALRSLGVVVCVEKHLQKTFLDGSLFLQSDRNPLIGLTLRFDRIDYFWFTLMHEIAHLILHANSGISQFYDDLETPITHSKLEHEADELAREMLIPENDYVLSPAKHLHTPEAAEHLANKLDIHPAIVAGRMRYEANSYRILSNMVGKGEVRRLFPEVEWN